jgi:heptosyltransferase II
VPVFLDRDGTLNPDPGYIATPSGFELLPGVGAALARLKRAGARLIIVTNQSGIARGKFTVRDLNLIHTKLRTLLAEEGVLLDGIYVCPHHPDDRCHCRKPGTAMIERAVTNLHLDMARAYVVGDQARDVEMALRVGARVVLVTTGVGSLEALAGLRGKGIEPNKVACSLADAAEWILADALTSAPAPP